MQNGMKSHCFVHSFVALLSLIALACASRAADIVAADWHGRPAFRISDGKTEAVIVPELAGRIMRYGTVGGRNWIWNAENQTRQDAWTNVGGDKTFIGPHPEWKRFAEKIWPPPFPTWDTKPHTAELLAGNRLRTGGPVWEKFGARVVREFSFAATGELIIEQTLEKVEADEAPVAVWTVTQITPPDAVFIPLGPLPAQARGFHPLGGPLDGAVIERVPPALLRVQPTPRHSYKIGTDSPAAAIAAVKGGVAFVQRAMDPPVPPREDASSFPVEFYNHGAGGAEQYVELELLSARRALHPGEKLTQTVRWSLHELPAGEAQFAVMERLLRRDKPPEPR